METNVTQLRQTKARAKIRATKKTTVTAQAVMFELRQHLATTVRPYLKEGHKAEEVVAKLESSLVQLAIQKTSGFFGRYIQTLFQ